MEQAIAERRTKIEAHSYFPRLSKDTRNNTKNGLTDKIVSEETILRYMRIEPSTIWSASNHFSQHMHSTAYAADQLGALAADQTEDFQFSITLLKDVQGIFALVILTTLYGFGQPADVVPLNVLDVLLFWQD